jgi:hypothetical protein
MQHAEQLSASIITLLAGCSTCLKQPALLYQVYGLQGGAVIRISTARGAVAYLNFLAYFCEKVNQHAILRDLDL